MSHPTLTDRVQPGTGAVDMMFRFEALLLAIRRDLGHPNKGVDKGVDKGDVLGLWVNDIDDYLE